MPKELGSNQEKICDTSFTKSHTGQNERMNIDELFFGLGKESLDIFGAYMIQTIYENYLRILGKTET